MTNAIIQYRELDIKLAKCRTKYGGSESDEEDAILDMMDELWRNLTSAEQQQLNSEGPHFPLYHTDNLNYTVDIINSGLQYVCLVCGYTKYYQTLTNQIKCYYDFRKHGLIPIKNNI